MEKEIILQNFGLTDTEIKVYFALLQTEEATASEIAKKTGKNRTFTYDRLKKLGDIGLVSSVIKEGKKYFKAAEPSHFLSVLKEREQQIKDILPELEKLKITSEEEPKTEVYSGINGVKTVLNLMLKKKKEILLHGTIKKFQKVMGIHFNIWNERRIKEKIKLKILSNEYINLNFCISDLLAEEENAKISSFTFGDLSLIVMWGDYPVAILIKSKEIAKSNVSFFNTIWNREVKIYSGKEGIRRAFMILLEDTKEFIGFGYSKQLSDIYTVEFSDNWHTERIKRNITSKIIAFDELKTREYFKLRTEKKKDFYVRFLPEEVQGPACISLSDKMMATFVYTEKKLRVILNRNKETIEVYKKYFKKLWIKSV